MTASPRIRSPGEACWLRPGRSWSLAWSRSVLVRLPVHGSIDWRYPVW